MPTKKKGLERDIEVDRSKIDREVHKAGLTYTKIAAAIMVIIGALLVLFNIEGVVIAFVGFVLIYFGLRMLGIHLTYK